MSKVILVTGAGRGLGTDVARQAIEAGRQVVATGRRPEEVEKTLGGPQDNLLAVRLDVTSLNGQQPGDPVNLAHALLTLAGQDQPPLRFVAGADAIEGVSAKARELLAQAEASRELGGNLGHADA